MLDKKKYAQKKRAKAYQVQLKPKKPTGEHVPPFIQGFAAHPIACIGCSGRGVIYGGGYGK